MQIRIEFLKDEDIDSFIKCAQRIESLDKNKIAKRKVKWFVSSDQAWVIEKIKNETMHSSDKGEKVISGKGKIGHVLNDQNAYERSILDIESLGRCDRLIVTGGSTFGFVAAFKTQRRLYFVEVGRQCALFDFSAPSRRPSGPAVF